MTDFIEVELDKKVLNHLGYEFKWKEWKRKNSGKFYLKFSLKQYLAILKNGKEIRTFDIPATYEYEGRKHKIITIGEEVFAFCA